MADVPSAQSVGREFVRQYYTMMNERPESLHRFFSHSSSYVHGGIEKPGEEQPPVKGQVAIHQKIMSLGFKECHAKIRQVDCQETVDNAVVIQVTGELSNNMGPMRRFMQTFVLARQSAKMFYVHNDIFRYQDEVFHDFDGGVAADFEENHVVAVGAEERSVEVEEPAAVDGHDGNAAAVAGTLQHDEPEQQLVSEPAVVHDLQPAAAAGASEPVESAPAEPEVVPAPNETEQPAAPTGEVELEKEDVAKTAVEVTEAPAQPAEPPVQKPFSWATLAGKNASSPASATSAAVAPKPQATIRPERKAESAPAPSAQPLPQRMPRPRPADQIGDSSGDRKWSPSYDGSSEGKPSSGVVVPDTQQMFVGNLPHNVDDKELIEFFSQFGNVVDVKINRKGFARDLPNFGFVSFDSVEAVSKALAAKPLMLYGKHRINAEEKKEQSELFNRPRGAPRGGRGFGGPFRGPYRGGRGGHFPTHTAAAPAAAASTDAPAAGTGGFNRPR